MKSVCQSIRDQLINYLYKKHSVYKYIRNKNSAVARESRPNCLQQKTTPGSNCKRSYLLT